MKKILVVYLISFASLNVYSSYTLDQETTIAEINGISLAYKSIGIEEDPAVLMVMGLLASHKVWGETIVNGLVDSGYRVILFDNRDTGDSEKLDRLGKPNLYWKYFLYSMGIGFSAPYTLEDMSRDGIALLDYLEIEEAHIVGASMGGMIAQIIASKYPDKTISLVSLMSSPRIPKTSEISDGNQENLRNMENVDAEGAALTDGGYDLVDGAYVVNADGEGTHNRVRTLDAANGSSVDINDWRRRMVENLGRFDDRDVHNYRVMLALGGEFDNDWKFDFSYVYGKNDSAAIAGGYFDLSKVAEQVGPTYTDDNGVLKCGADSTTTISDACVPLNIFGQNVVTQEMIDYSSVDATVQGLNEQRVISAIFNGPVADYDGGTIYAAVGYENRDETGATVQDSLIIDGKLTDRSGLNTSGGYSLEEIFAEFIIPFYDRAELQIAARSSDYSSFGTNTTAELGLEVYMTENSTFRIASSMAYRAQTYLRM